METGAVAVQERNVSGFARARLSYLAVKEAAIRVSCFLCAALSVVTTIGILFVLLREAFEFFRVVPIGQFLTGKEWTPTIEPQKFGVLPLIAGTLQITVGSAIISISLGLLSAIYLAEYAAPRVRRILKPALELLAGVPTVVYGYFALLFVTPLLKKVIPDLEVYNALSGSIVVGIMTLPLVSSLCEDAISAVPKALREGAYGLGSTKLEVTAKIILPAAFSGIMASFILAISRAIGETMAVSLASGNTPKWGFNPTESIQTMTAFIVNIAGSDESQTSVAYKSMFAVAATLFVFTMTMNLGAQALVRKFRRVYE